MDVIRRTAASTADPAGTAWTFLTGRQWAPGLAERSASATPWATSEADVDAAIDDLGHLRCVVSSRRVRRVQPELAAIVDEVAANLAAALHRAATADTCAGPAGWRCHAALRTQVSAVHYAAHPEALEAERKALSRLVATVGMRASVDHPFADMVNDALTAVEALAGAVAALLATEPLHPDAPPVDPIAAAPEQRPPTGPRVPTGPPSTGPGPRLCAA